MLIVLEAHVGQIQLTAALDIDLRGPIDQDVGYLVVPQQRLQRAQAEQLVFDLFDQPRPVGVGEQPTLLVEDLAYRGGYLLRGHVGLQALQARDVEGLEQPVVHRELELLKAVGHRAALALGALPANHRALLLLRRSAFLLGYPFDQFHRLTNLQERLPNTPRRRDIRPGASSESSLPAASRRASSS